MNFYLISNVWYQSRSARFTHQTRSFDPNCCALALREGGLSPDTEEDTTTSDMDYKEAEIDNHIQDIQTAK